MEMDIHAKCGGDLEINIHTMRKPRIIILNILQDISITNIKGTILTQNTDLNLRKGES
jgi:hypothetical protein